MAKLMCYGGAGNATGANFLLELSDQKILIDCGMQQGGESAHVHNRQTFQYDPASINFLFITHAHIDHVGLIPKLVHNGFKGTIYSTPETKALAELLLLDAVKIGREEENPLYTTQDVENSLSLWQTLEYHAPHDLPAGRQVSGFTVELFDAGHVLGSSMLKFTTPGGKSMLFTGDLGNSPSPLLKEREKVSGVDYILMESVYGDRNHENREEREERFKLIVSDAIKRNGALLIPAFSLERAQIILSLLDDLFEAKVIPTVPVYLDSPLAIKITAIYERAIGGEPFDFKELKYIQSAHESREIEKEPGAKIIIAGSGMSTAGRILGHEAHYLPDPNSTILLMGYQAAGTLGRQIEEGMKKVIIDDQPVTIRAHVEKISGFSGHADSDALVNFVSENEKSLKKVFVAMGETHSQIFLAQRLRDELNVDAIATEEGKSYEVDLG